MQKLMPTFYFLLTNHSRKKTKRREVRFCEEVIESEEKASIYIAREERKTRESIVIIEKTQACLIKPYRI
jgi:hypothetical protein